MEQQQIQEETKKLLEKFSQALEKVKSSEEWNVERFSDRRIESLENSCDNNFRKIMFENAPSKTEEFIMGDKKTW
jgi:hypothetical protein